MEIWFWNWERSPCWPLYLGGFGLYLGDPWLCLAGPFEGGTGLLAGVLLWNQFLCFLCSFFKRGKYSGKGLWVPKGKKIGAF